VHEIGLCEEIVAATVREAAGREVSAVRVTVHGHPVDHEVVDMGFRLAAAGTVAEGAHLDVLTQPPVVQCRSCGNRAPAASALAMVACPACGGVDVDADDSEGLVVEWIRFTEAGRPNT
jgi:hydrogenase nickel incorporation protein HypA/HybF